MLRHREIKEVIGYSKYGFTKSKFFLINLVAYDGVTALVEKGRETSIIYLDSCKTLDTISHNILISSLERHGFDRVAVNGLKIKQRPVTNSVPQGSVLGQILFNISASVMNREIKCPSLCGAIDMQKGRNDIQIVSHWQAQKLGSCGPHKVQEGQALGPAPGGQSQTQAEPG